MHRFFVDRSQVEKEKIVILGGDVNHIRNVLRMKIGDQIQISDGSNQVWLCQIVQMENDKIETENSVATVQAGLRRQRRL